MILDIIFLALVVGILVMIYKIKFSKSVEQKIKIPNEQQLLSKSGQAQRQIVQKRQQPKNEQQQQQLQQSEQQSSQQQNNGGFIDRKKQMLKQRKQRQKQQRKRARQHFLQDQKQKQDDYDKQMQEKDRLQQQKRKKQEEYYQKLIAQEKKKKDQQFNKWKHMFKVQAEGKQKDTPQQQQRKKQQFQNKFLKTLKDKKLSLLEDLSHSFSLPTKQIIQKIKDLQKRQLIDGIFDERGKYLVIQKMEWQAIRNYIKVKGRVKKTQIMSECARIIKIPEQSEDIQLNSLIENQIKQSA